MPEIGTSGSVGAPAAMPGLPDHKPSGLGSGSIGDVQVIRMIGVFALTERHCD